MKISAGCALYQRNPRRADHRAAENGQLADRGMRCSSRYSANRVAADVGEHGQRAGGDDRAADGQTVEAVGEVHRVGGADNHQDDKDDEGKKGQRPQMRQCAGQR